jgi:hypothetical protein
VERRNGQERIMVKFQGDPQIRSIRLERHPYLMPSRKNEILEQAASAKATMQLNKFLEL